MLDGRKRIGAGLAAAAVIGVSLLPSAPAAAEPDIEDVKAQIEQLYHESEQAAERRNDAELELERLQSELELLQQDEAAQSDGFDSVRSQVADSVVAQSQGSSISPVAEAALSDDTAAFLAQLSTASTYSNIQGRLVDAYSTELQALEVRRSATEERVAQIAAVEEQAAEESATIDQKVDEAEALLAELEEEAAEEAATLFADEGTADTSQAAEIAADVPVSGRAGAAVQYALAQVGDSYVYGASGPDSFDCSGLTSMAWAQAGVSLPHSSKAQFSSGRKVSRSELQPGDLVFYYSPISHVGIYIGNGQIVHAANPRSGVAIASVGSMPYSGAVRPG